MSIKWNKILKKSVLCIASAVMLISGLTTHAHALTGTTDSITYDDWILVDPKTGEEIGPEDYLMVDGKSVYCVDYYTDFFRNKTVTAGTYKDLGISEEKAKRLAVIAYYGNKVTGRTSRDWYAITQGLLWREIHDEDDLYFVSTPTAPDIKTTMKCWNEILADVDRYYMAPSFAKTTQTLDSDETLTLTDTNGVLKDMVVVNDGGLDVTISKNQLIIKGNSDIDSANIVLKKNIPASEIGTTIIYTSDDCQSLGSFKISDPFQSSLTVSINQYGSLELTKYNADQSAPVAGTTYRITGEDDYDQTFTTDENGKIRIERLVPGSYQALETQSANGYLINVNEKSFTIKENETTKIDFTNDEPTGQIKLTKAIDTSKTNGLKGDASLEGNVYGLYAKEKITNKAATIVFYEKDALVSSKKTDENGDIQWDNLPLGNYYIKEISSHDSLVLNDTVINVSLEYEGETVSKVTSSKKTTNRVNMQKIQIFKSGEKEGISGLVKGLQGSEFTFKLKSEVDHVGWDDAITYAIITTDADGIANTPYLPYGQYLVKETKTPEDYMTAPDFTVSVIEDYLEYEDAQQIKRININNRPFSSLVRIVKVDEESNETVTLNSASFKIKDSKGNDVVQKVSGQKIDTFTTNSKNQIVSATGQNGEVVLPLELDAGTYTIEEIKAPEGFLELEEPVTFTIAQQYDYDTDEDETPIFTVKIKNKKPTGKLEIQKQIEQFHADTCFVNRDDLSGYRFTLYAKKDIISPVDGSILFQKGDEFGTYTTDKYGKITVENIPMGSYVLKEISTVEGCILNNEEIDVTFTQKDTVTQEYVVHKDIENKTTKIQLSKKAVTGDDELEGAHLVVKDQDGNIIDEWDTGQKPHIIEGLTVGNQYTLTETICPDGYVKATTISFTVSNTGEVQNVTMIDKTVSMSKTDVGGNEIEGAVIQVIDKDGNIIDEWTSTKEEHIIRNLEEGKTYTLHEEVAAEGYVKASDIEFTVTQEKTDDHITMVDKIVDMSKLDVAGAELPGASMQVLDKELNIVDEWISTEESHRINGLEEGKTYTLHEEAAPDGYVIATDIEFTVTDKKENQHLEMTDKQVLVSKLDQMDHLVEGAKLQILDHNGTVIDEWDSLEVYAVSNLKAGETYVLHEVSAPKNYMKAENIEFTVTDDQTNQNIKMIDIKTDDVGITKYDATSSKELPGAHLEIKDENGNIIDEWISTEEQHVVKLKVGSKYTLTETIAPDGYAVAETITFTVDDNGKIVQQIKMYDDLLPAAGIVHTGDSTMMMPYAILFVVCGLIFVGVKHSRKKNKE